MESRLKERLTGAAIIVALIVLLVPEMFRGQRNDASSPSAASSSGDGPPIRSYTIDLSNAPARNPPVQAAAPAPSAPAPAVSTGNNADSSSEPAPSAAVTPSEAAAAPAPVPVTASSRPAAASAVHPAAAHAAPHADAVPASGAASAGWSVQLGLFAKRDNAERLMHAAQQKGFAVSVSSADAKGQYKVHAVGLGDRTAAQNLANRLKVQGFAAAVVAPQ